jgi:predicted transcriptional regulator
MNNNMEKVRYKFVYNRMNKLNLEGKTVLQLRITYKRVSKYFTTQIYITPNYWNLKKCELSQKCKNYND